MNNRLTLIIILALLALLAAYGLSRHPAQDVSDNSVNEEPMSSAQEKPARPTTLAEDISRTQERLDRMKKMTPKQWTEEMKNHPRRKGTLEEAIKRNEQRLAALQGLTQEEWQNLQNGGPAAQQTKMKVHNLPNLGPRNMPNAAGIGPGKDAR